MAGQRTNGVEVGDIGVEFEDAGSPVIIAGDGSIAEDSSSAGIPTVEPASIIFEPSESDQPRRKKRGPNRNKAAGSTATATQKEISSDLTAILFSAHWMLAELCKTAELKLTEDEAGKLGKAVARVNAEFGGAVFDPKTAAIVNLAFVAGGIYVPRVIAVTNNHKKAKAEKQQGQSPSQSAQVLM